MLRLVQHQFLQWNKMIFRQHLQRCRKTIGKAVRLLFQGRVVRFFPEKIFYYGKCAQTLRTFGFGVKIPAGQQQFVAAL